MNLVDFIMNVLCFMSIITKMIYSNYMKDFIAHALEKDEFVDFENPMTFFMIVSYVDSFLYVLMAVSFIKTLVFWKPDKFRIVIDMLGKFFGSTTFYTVLMSQTLSTVGTYLLANALAAFNYGFYDMRSNTIRATVIGSQGWFWQV